MNELASDKKFKAVKQLSHDLIAKEEMYSESRFRQFLKKLGSMFKLKKGEKLSVVKYVPYSNDILVLRDVEGHGKEIFLNTTKLEEYPSMIQHILTVKNFNLSLNLIKLYKF